MSDHSFSKEIVPNIQSKPPLTQLEATASCPIYLGEETNTHLTTTSFQVVVESEQVSPWPPLLQAKQPQFPQPLRCPSLDMLQPLHALLVVRGPKLQIVFEARSTLGWSAWLCSVRAHLSLWRLCSRCYWLGLQTAMVRTKPVQITEPSYTVQRPMPGNSSSNGMAELFGFLFLLPSEIA